jgi:hypothetical protein
MDTARDALEDALSNAKRELDLYYQARQKWIGTSKASGGADQPEPTPPDPETLASKYGLTGDDTRLVDALEIEEYEIAQAYFFPMSSMQPQRISFAESAYTENVPLYKAQRIPYFQLNVEFLYWKVDEKEPYVPELKDIRDQVAEFWKMQQAFQIAKNEAATIAEKVDGTRPLAESVDEKLADRIIETGEFSWLTHGAMPSGMAPPTISPVMGVESPGTDFMQAIFALEPNEVGVANNQPQTVVYVARMIREFPDEAKRREDFLTSGLSLDTFQIASTERQRLMGKWYEDLEQEMRLEWQRPPELFGR